MIGGDQLLSNHSSAIWMLMRIGARVQVAASLNPVDKAQSLEESITIDQWETSVAWRNASKDRESHSALPSRLVQLDNEY